MPQPPPIGLGSEALHLKFFLVEDEPVHAEAVILALQLLERDAELIHRANGSDAVYVIENEKPDVVLLDLGLPGEGGLSVLGRIRAVSAVPVIIVSGTNSPHSIVRGLEAGADDYIVKPFYAIELMARINAVRRRSEGRDERDSVFEWHDTHIDFDGRMLRLKGETVPLTAQEWEILECLWKRRAGFVPLSKLREAVWGDEDTSDDAVSAAVSRLRRRLGHAGHLIRSARGIGYAFDGALPPSK